MHRQIALSYAIAGLAVAIAVVTAFGATTGLFGPRAPAIVEAPTTEAETGGTEGALLADARGATAAQDVEVVYVDEPAPRRGHDGGEDDDEDSDDDSDDESDDDSDEEHADENGKERRGERGGRREHDDD